MTVVLDASALLAAVLYEAGGNVVRATANTVIGAVNMAEVVERLNRDVNEAAVRLAIAALDTVVIAIDHEIGVAAGMMARFTRSGGLSLGDRCCLALGRQLGCPVLTADRAWADFASAVGVEVRLIR